MGSDLNLMLIIITLIFCSSVITTLILYNNNRVVEDLRWIASDELPSAKINFMDRDRTKEKLKYVFLVFPSSLFFFSILVWAISLFLK